MSHPDVGIFEGILPLRHIGMLKAPHPVSSSSPKTLS